MSTCFGARCHSAQQIYTRMNPDLQDRDCDAPTVQPPHHRRRVFSWLPSHVVLSFIFSFTFACFLLSGRIRVASLVLTALLLFGRIAVYGYQKE